MKVLLDTHTFLWRVTQDPRLSTHAREIVSDGENEAFVSAVTEWEIAIKAQLGRLKLPDEPRDFVIGQLKLNAMISLPIEDIQKYDVTVIW